MTLGEMLIALQVIAAERPDLIDKQVMAPIQYVSADGPVTRIETFDEGVFIEAKEQPCS